MFAKNSKVSFMITKLIPTNKKGSEFWQGLQTIQKNRKRERKRERERGY